MNKKHLLIFILASIFANCASDSNAWRPAWWPFKSKVSNQETFEQLENEQEIFKQPANDQKEVSEIPINPEDALEIPIQEVIVEEESPVGKPTGWLGGISDKLSKYYGTAKDKMREYYGVARDTLFNVPSKIRHLSTSIPVAHYNERGNIEEELLKIFQTIIGQSYKNVLEATNEGQLKKIGLKMVSQLSSAVNYMLDQLPTDTRDKIKSDSRILLSNAIKNAMEKCFNRLEESADKDEKTWSAIFHNFLLDELLKRVQYFPSNTEYRADIKDLWRNQLVPDPKTDY